MSFELLSFLNVVVLLGAAAAGIIAVLSVRVIDSIIALAAVGSFMAVEFIILQAPDVAIAEAAVGAVLGTVLYVIALYRVRGKGKEDQD